MKRSTWMIGIGAALAMLASQATLADNSQQEKMKTCNETASSKNLSGDARKTFMQKCLSGTHSG
jgi:psiF repeat